MRGDYYNVGYVPTFRYDGKRIQDLFGTAPDYPEFFAFLEQTVDSLLQIPSPLRINLSQYPSQDWDSVYVSFDVVAVDTIIDDTTPDLYLAVVEEHHTYRAPTGSWDYSFRDMIPDADGEVISIQKGDSLHFDWAYVIDPIFNTDGLITTIWVQNDPDGSVINPKMRNKVLQAASAKVIDVASVAGDGAPARVWLGQSRPNPFTDRTEIAYSLGRGGKVRLSIYSPTGQLITHLVDGYSEPGLNTAAWDGRDRFGRDVGSGMYYYRLATQDEVRAGRMVLLK